MSLSDNHENFSNENVHQGEKSDTTERFNQIY